MTGRIGREGNRVFPPRPGLDYSAGFARRDELGEAADPLLDLDGPVASSARVSSSRPKTRTPLSRARRTFAVEAGSGPRLQLDISASRPPGANTRTISASARIGSSIR